MTKPIIVTHTEAFSDTNYVHIYSVVDSIRFKLDMREGDQNAKLIVSVLSDGEYKEVHSETIDLNEEGLDEKIKQILKTKSVYGDRAEEWTAIADRLVTGDDI